MKTKATLLTTIVFLMVAGLSFAGETATSTAKKELYAEIKGCFDNEVRKWDNFFYQNGINKVKETVEVSFVVNKDQTLSLIRVTSDNPNAKNFVKYIFKNQNLMADELLAGKAYTFNLLLRYEAN